MTQGKDDAAMRERVRKAIDESVYIGRAVDALDRATDAVLAAIPEPAATPTPPRVELDATTYVTWSGVAFQVHTRHYVHHFPSAASLVSAWVQSSQQDAKHAELLALKQPAGAPSWWLNDYPSGGLVLYSDEATARLNAHNQGRMVVPLYEHPPTPSAPPEVLGYLLLRMFDERRALRAELARLRPVVEAARELEAEVAGDYDAKSYARATLKIIDAVRALDTTTPGSTG